MKAVKASGKRPSELSAEIEIFPQVLVNARVSNENKKRYSEDPEIMAAISAIEEEMQGSGRVLIRPSGTEPLVRVMIEGSDPERIQRLAADLAALISAKFGD
jgi:phosphoglucosamine mutase